MNLPSLSTSGNNKYYLGAHDAPCVDIKYIIMFYSLFRYLNFIYHFVFDKRLHEFLGTPKRVSRNACFKNIYNVSQVNFILI